MCPVSARAAEPHTGGASTGAAAAGALVAFAANSLFCRVALRDGTIDPATFSTIRLCTGALVLVVLVRPRWPARLGPTLASAAALFAYALPFAFAYRSLTTGTGALLLFGAVQVTMSVAAVWKGERPSARQWGGVAVAFTGLTYLVWPGVSAPSLADAVLMLAAGVAWAVYSVRGKSAGDPATATALNFLMSVPLALIVSGATLGHAHAEARGIMWAVLSGGAASALGYIAWYRALTHLAAVTASVLQLLVPLLTAVAGVLLLDEPVSARLVIAAILILGGVVAASKR
jgi:drug/metabolite transporter (DMT)-like permease